MTRRREKQGKRKASNPNVRNRPEQTIGRNLSVIGKTPNQKKLIRLINENKMVFCSGPAGTGKTHIATSLAIIGLLTGKYERVIITRPLVQSGEDTGFLPGDIKKKLDPYMRPIYDEMYKYMSYSDLQTLFNGDKVEICPFAYMRGRNFHKCFIVADECQNADYKQLKMLLTRIGDDSKMVLTGDSQQSDLPTNKLGGFDKLQRILANVPDVGIFNLESCDIVRTQLVADIVRAIDDYEEVSQ